MTDHPRDPRRDDDRPGGDRPGDDDPGANTEMFRAFAARDEPAPPPKPVGAPFRIVTLLVGLLVFAGIVWLLLR